MHDLFLSRLLFQLENTCNERIHTIEPPKVFRIISDGGVILVVCSAIRGKMTLKSLQHNVDWQLF